MNEYGTKYLILRSVLPITGPPDTETALNRQVLRDVICIWEETSESDVQKWEEVMYIVNMRMLLYL